MDSYKGKLLTISRELETIIQNYDTFITLYKECKKDDFFSKVDFLEFSASLSKLEPANTHLSFRSYLDSVQFPRNPYLSELIGFITFKSSGVGISTTVYIQFLDQFIDPEKAFEIYNKYNYLESDSYYHRVLDNSNAGKLEISGQVELPLSRVAQIDTMLLLAKEVFRQMHKYLSDRSWLDMEEAD